MDQAVDNTGFAVDRIVVPVGNFAVEACGNCIAYHLSSWHLMQ